MIPIQSEISQVVSAIDAAEPSDPTTFDHVRVEVLRLRERMEHGAGGDLLACIDATVLMLQVGSAGGAGYTKELLATTKRLINFCKSQLPLEEPGFRRLQASSADGAPTPPSSATSLTPPAGADEGTAQPCKQALLGEILVNLGVVEECDREIAVAYQNEHGGRIGDAFIATGLATFDSIESAARLQKHMSFGETKPAPYDGDDDEEGEKNEEEAETEHPKLVTDTSLGELLLSRRVITRVQLFNGLRVMRAAGVRMGEALVEIGVVTWDQIDEAVACQDGQILDESSTLIRHWVADID